jgi:arylsulfatase A-like enzyme
MYLGMESVVGNRGFYVCEDAGDNGGQHESSFGVDEASTVGRALDWIDTIQGSRFFLTYLPIAGHHPYETPRAGPFAQDGETGRYLNALNYADESMAALIDGIRARGLEQQTLFVILGDHGEAFGQHEGNYGHSLFLYEENIRVPFLIYAPGLIGEKICVESPVSLIDAAPTTLALLGSKLPEDYQGVSLLEALPGSALFYTDYSLSLMGLRDGSWKYIFDLSSGRSKLFDLRSDPAETRDVSLLHPDQINAYRGRVLGWSAAQKALIVDQTRASK